MAKYDKLSLASLRREIEAGTRDVTFQTDDGALTQEVYIPKFTIEKGMLDGGTFPASDLTLGGFFMDKYPCSHKKATAGSMGVAANVDIKTDGTDTNIPVSLPGKTPWTDITQDNARKACANRKINGVACHLVTPREWAAVCFLSKYLGHDMKGNTDYGRDYRDPDLDGYYGIVDPSSGNPSPEGKGKFCRVLTGTGPNSWSHNGMANGVFDMCGNIWEWTDMVLNDGVYTYKRPARLHDGDGITSVDTTVTLDNAEDAALWPTDGGKVQIESEVIQYQALSYANGRLVLTGCTRGADGTTAAAHKDDVAAYGLIDVYVIPGGASSHLSADVSATDTVFKYKDFVGAQGITGFRAGDTVCTEKERMTVVSVDTNQQTITVTRGVNGTPTSSYKTGQALIKMNTSMNCFFSTDWIQAYRQHGGMAAMRSDSLAVLGLPLAATTNIAGYGWIDVAPFGQRVVSRGGCWDTAGFTVGGWVFHGLDVPLTRGALAGFRAALSI